VVEVSLKEKLLANQGEWTVQYAIHGADALAKMEQACPDLVISDLLMPEMTGLEFVSSAREKYPSVPVILMTSQGSEEIAVQALLLGAASYVPKRSLAHFLIETIQKVLTVSSRGRTQSRLMGCMVRNESTFILDNDPTLFGPLIMYLQEGAVQMGLWNDADRTRVGVALEEALTNALYHGNLEVGSELREQDLNRYYEMIDCRRRQSPYRDRRIEVEVKFSYQRALFMIRDGGPGFDPASLPDPTDTMNLAKSSGRGILLMRAFMDSVDFNPQGNAVTLVKSRQPGPVEAAALDRGAAP
jgi:CheY-like chemotaxis protein/anti-sigma regulatory factor (Ser/Thr protein kinase)